MLLAERKWGLNRQKGCRHSARELVLARPEPGLPELGLLEPDRQTGCRCLEQVPRALGRRGPDHQTDCLHSGLE
jgi:hypothetical protein